MRYLPYTSVAVLNDEAVGVGCKAVMITLCGLQMMNFQMVVL